jgi:SAM-dependent methyltransferase
MLSRNHGNRRPYNWSIYESGDALLQSFTPYYRGVLYDLGCGDMPYRDWLLQYADRYIGVDWGNSLHEKKADIFADLNSALPIRSNDADTVVSLSTMEHLCEPQQFLNEVHRILKPRGSLILQVPFMWWIHEAPHDYFRYTRFGLQHLLEKAGFQHIQIQAQTGFWVTWVLKFNYQSMRLIRGPRWMRTPIELALRAVWFLDQHFARWLDRHWECEQETAGYFVLAKKE